jgi:O-methyltransferase involved in polyketide biosynthesis
MLKEIGRDPRLFASPSTVPGVTYRSLWFDRVAREFFERNPDAVGINLGCGLNTASLTRRGGRFTWVDVDLPEVIAIRRRFFVDTGRRRMVFSIISDLRASRPEPHGRCASSRISSSRPFRAACATSPSR